MFLMTQNLRFHVLKGPGEYKRFAKKKNCYDCCNRIVIVDYV